MAVADASHMMKAVSYSKYGGGADGLKDVELPIPRPKREELLVKVEACSINPIDWKVQKGAMKPVLPYRFPHVPGADITGEVVSVGPAVTTFVPGDKIISCLGRAGGGLAEYAIAPITTTIKRRKDVSPVQGAAMGICAFAALQSVRNSAGINIEEKNKKKQELTHQSCSWGSRHTSGAICQAGRCPCNRHLQPPQLRVVEIFGSRRSPGLIQCKGGSAAKPLWKQIRRGDQLWSTQAIS